MRSEPLVGVVIAARDGVLYLREAIESVLGQTESSVEIVVVDDGSVDGTRDVARAFAPDVRCLASPRRGLGAARNAGVRAVRGHYVAFLDQDDLWPAEKLERQLSAFRRRAAPDVVFGHVREFLTPGLDRRVAARLRCFSDPRPAALPGTMLATRAALARGGRFQTRWISNDFMAWLLAARERGLREIMLSEHVLSRRLHASNFSHRTEVTYPEYVRVLKESLDRRRRAHAA